MEPWMILPAAALVYLGLGWLGKTDTGIGRKLRASDHYAWEIAVESKRRELDELLAAEPPLQ